MLFSEGKDLPVNVVVEQAAKAELQSHSANRIELYAEHLDASRFPGESYYKLFSGISARKIRAATARSGHGVPRARVRDGGRIAAEVFPDVPVVFVSVNELEVPGQFRLPGTTGIVQRHDFQGTFELILRLQPGTQRIVVIGGVAPMDQIFIHRAEEVVQSFKGRAQFEFWTNRPVSNAEAAEMFLNQNPPALWSAGIANARTSARPLTALQ